MASMWSFPDDRYAAMEAARTLLGFSRAEWKILLHALSKTNNGWLNFIFGDIHLDFKKSVNVDEIHLLISNRKGRTVKSLKYVYDLTDFTTPSARTVNSSCVK